MADKTKEELAAEERKKINVESNKEEEKEEDKDDGEQEEKEEDEEEQTDDDKGLDGDSEDNKEKIEKSEKTEEELEKEKHEAKSSADKARIQKRIDKEVAKRKVLEEENKELKRKLEAKPDAEKALTEEDVESRAEAKAKVKSAEREFVNACNRLADAAKKIDKDFKAKIDEVTEEYEPIPGMMIGILDDMDNGGEVLSYLANNPEEYGEVHGLTEGKMGRRLQKISDKLIEDKKPKPKKISSAPKPNEPVDGNRISPSILSDKMPMEEWVRKRNADVALRAENKRKGFR